MKTADEMVFLLTIDNTLLDNDRIVADLGDHFAYEFGEESRGRYWEIFEALHIALGYADYLDAVQRYRVGVMTAALEVIAYLQLGTNGDSVGW